MTVLLPPTQCAETSPASTPTLLSKHARTSNLSWVHDHASELSSLKEFTRLPSATSTRFTRNVQTPLPAAAVLHFNPNSLRTLPKIDAISVKKWKWSRARRSRSRHVVVAGMEAEYTVVFPLEAEAVMAVLADLVATVQS